MPEDEFPIHRAMVVHAHPDDAEFSAAGTIAKLAADGVEWTLVVATQGNRGGEGDRTEAELAAVRIQEQRAAADLIGIKEIVNLGYDDGSLTPSLDLRRDITRVIRQYRPDLVITANPVRNFGPIGGNHPDHLAVGEATLAAIYPTARNPMALPELREEGLEKWVVTWVYVSGAHQAEPNLYVDVSDYVDVKVNALLAHASQLGDWVGEWVRTQSRRAAQEAMERGMGSMEYAEAFYRMYTGELTSGAALKEVFGPLPEGMTLPERTERASLGDRRP
ncbi:MAG TPA: PIG-L deacetylase family protein [Candidatus Dormibacteraeota bacterium]|jgi:LmbE family N-acetylglucosaminyl deacetylase|nr:PIG-L deacetylase family protein [Candidatus Dormibacteraeota bacterium]